MSLRNLLAKKALSCPINFWPFLLKYLAAVVRLRDVCVFNGLPDFLSSVASEAWGSWGKFRPYGNLGT
jgi:hypothetical protein